MSERVHDVVLYGATSFVGALTADYLARHTPTGTRVALAGRSRDKLERVRASLPAPGSDWPLIVADSTDRAALDAMAASTTALATTVGPYAKYGLPLVEACAAAGTHYADLTGEATFAREAIDATDARAQATGARIVHSCGYDSVPSDLGVMLLHTRVQADGEGELTDVDAVVRIRGGVSGGTIDSMRGLADTVKADRSTIKILRDPYSLSPDRGGEPDTRQPSDNPPPHRIDGGWRDGRWAAPFVMASYNTRIVRRSNAIAGYAYGKGLRYGEVMATGSGPAGALTAGAVAAGLGALLAGFATPGARQLLDRVLPKPGEGPSEQTQAKGWFRHDLDATTTTGARYTGRISASGDPGYAATAVMLGESVLCLALDGDRLPDRAGSLTPATAMGPVLVERLRTAGHVYEAGRAS
ncbi:saccharopine dehydrogenase NADP-binding domain-containing protein [Actinomycetospora endophytica]|uniref:Saccharopine dehydrogenase NADP-binding domain-containing protein n=1 Tax=Actinomycetospora endophytica TaxID=2291215 RepID=A0ABS8PJI1_9PSEU|nr:saccharopine dehydrogenase NADP-binding domain-containing protein [Actinomycetospora endophytica]MCD2197154.1 saccharopine dehydrogenase NADP-binding domain-containing protein [Actinomycetospora endophytica]